MPILVMKRSSVCGMLLTYIKINLTDLYQRVVRLTCMRFIAILRFKTVFSCAKTYKICVDR